MLTLKSLIIELKDSGLSYQEISNILENQYGVVKSRQAISGLYKRATETLKTDKESQIRVCDIVNLYCICDSATQVYNELQRLGINITYRQILNVINKETKYIESVKRTIIANLESQLDSLSDIKDAIKSVEYRGVQISKKKFDEYFEQACIVHIRMRISSQLAKVYKLTSSKEMVKNIGESFNVGVRTADLK